MKDQDNAIRQPSLTDALIPLVFMILLLALSIILFGLDAASGPLQVALLMSAALGVSTFVYFPYCSLNIRAGQAFQYLVQRSTERRD